MKTFEITFTKNEDSGIYSANIVTAKNAEQATAYYEAQGYTVAGCTETLCDPKPGQPVAVIPEDWETLSEDGKNYLLLERRGCEFGKYDKARQESDIGNYRVQTLDEVIPCKNGRVYLFEFGSYDRYEHRTTSKKGGRTLKTPVKELIMTTALHMDAQFTDADGLTWSDLKMKNDFRATPVKYTEESILKWINSVSTIEYDGIKYVLKIDVNIKPGENYTANGLIHRYAKAHNIPETINHYGEICCKFYTGIYKCCKIHKTTKRADGETVTVLLERVKEA